MEQTIAKEKLTEAIQDTIKKGYRHFLVDMATGVGIWAAEILLPIKESGIKLTIEASTSADLKTSGWSYEARQQFYTLLQACDLVHFVQRMPVENIHIKINSYLIEHASLAIALYDRKGGETGALIRYARAKNIPFIEIPLL